MPIGDYQALMLLTLVALADGAEVRLGEIRERIAVSEKLTDREVSEKLPSGRQTVLANRVGWALRGMKHAGLMEQVRRAVYWLTDDDGQLLARGWCVSTTMCLLPIPRSPNGRNGTGSRGSICRTRATGRRRPRRKS